MTEKGHGWMDTQHSPEGTWRPVGAVAQILSHPTATYEILLTWESLMSSKSLPQQFRVAAPDDSMSPRVRRGEVAEFRRDVLPLPGDGILVRDANGDHYFRRYRQELAGSWEAYPINEAFRTLHSTRDQLELVAVLVGVPVQRWS